ncbi:Copia protein [Eumeta japonica]|uniref:Copia protein n=1 Tax=Eumeta variegata TaxID=151549 RepID=A0A4C1TEZ5_EUMVA|nr:Copia protein [Eumeta japonica]
MSQQANIEDIIIPIFDGANYSSWKLKLVTLLEYKECNEPAIGMMPDNYENTETLWKKKDLKARTITSTISDKQLKYISECKIAYGMIKKFEKKYKGKIEETKLHNYRTVEDFFVDFEKTINEFKTAGGKIDEPEKLRYLFRALPPSYSFIGDFFDVIPDKQGTVDYVRSKIKEKNMTTSESEKKNEDTNRTKVSEVYREVAAEMASTEVAAEAEVILDVNHRSTLHLSHGQLQVPEVLRKSKWHDKSQLEILVGYNENSNLVLLSNRVIDSRHVQIVEENTQLICLEKLNDKQYDDSETEQTSNVSSETVKTEYERDENFVDTEEDSTGKDLKDIVNDDNLNARDKDVDVESPKRKRCPPSRYSIPVSHYIYVNYVDANVPNTFEEAINSNDHK